MVSGALVDLYAGQSVVRRQQGRILNFKDEAPVAPIEFALPAIADPVEISMTPAHQRKPTQRNLYDSFSIEAASGFDSSG